MSMTGFTDHSAPRRDQSNRATSGALALFPSTTALWAGRVLSGLAVLFLLFDASVKLLELNLAIEANQQLGYPTNVIFWLGVLELICLVVYLVPRTSVLGAVLWTGYLGGAIATHVRVANPLFTHILFPTYVATFLWLGLWLRDERLRAVLPLRTTKY